jgi:hypothetical protein
LPLSEGEYYLYRAVALTLGLVAVAFFAVRLAEEPVMAFQKPEVRPAPEPFETAGASAAEVEDAGGQAPDVGDMMIGSFEAPESVPDYEILEERVVERDGARAARLLIDTRSRAEEEFVIITRDLKARYSDYDAVSAEFTDTEDVLFYNGDKLDPLTRDVLANYGGALIFNTYDGVYYIGYVYGPPNMDGYYVKAAD